ncbi:fatty acid desaturase [Gallaecimonas kandeliae]|uniref:fatty acid desaturase n=1 Tax=Gallaecimonas kandeliae TaxID=3029055 RepID=UPI002649FF5E|nr:fatty acid desaturase [Gallaecimonas kandeliae]WKE65949.1 fatty acid desaturase [Gallaecimonas kandeliae]
MTKPRLLWVNVTFFTVSTLMALVAAPLWGYFHGFETWQWLTLIVLFSYCNLSITAGYHRLWSHKTYQAHPALRWLFALGGALAIQNSVIHWSSDHRVHHRHVDDNKVDPYSAGRGFWFSHIGWMLREYQPDRYDDYGNVRDLQKDPVVAFQHKHYLALTLVMNFGIPLLLGMVFGDVIGALLLVGFVRIFLTHHTTFFINSLAHIWGKRTYSDKHTARDNGFLALLTFGEGYHNFHHSFENDYRNGIRWFDYDPTKWLIKGASLLGLAQGLRKTPEELIVKARLTRQLEETKVRAQAKGLCFNELHRHYEETLAAAQHYYQLRKRWLQMKKAKLMQSVEALELRRQLEEMGEKFRQMQSHWQQLRLQLA